MKLYVTYTYVTRDGTVGVGRITFHDRSTIDTEQELIDAEKYISDKNNFDQVFLTFWRTLKN